MMSGYYGQSYDSHLERMDRSTFHQMKKKYWTTKQAVIKKLGKKEDEFVVASDSALDAKLEVFKSIQMSCMHLLRIIERYQDRLCAIAQEENAMGRFLKTHSVTDKTRAGKIMVAVGKSQSFSSQQRLTLRVPLIRLYQEVETFRYRAIVDTLMTVNKMEAARTEYRGALLWMKDCSEQLDPDAYKQLDKFRKIQTQVKKAKAKFDKLKVDVMQKIDLLAASRCNMFSHVLANYQTTLLQFWNKTTRTMTAVADSFKGYQYYEFNLLKELAEPSKKLAEETTNKDVPERDIDEVIDLEKLISLNEEEPKERSDSLNNVLESEDIKESQEERIKPASKTSQKTTNASPTAKTSSSITPNTSNGTKVSSNTSPFIDFGADLIQEAESIEDLDFSGKLILEERMKLKEQMKAMKQDPKDLLSEDILVDDTEKDNITILNEIMNAPSTDSEFSHEWQSVFGNAPLAGGAAYSPSESDQPQQTAEYMPSMLLDMTKPVPVDSAGTSQQSAKAPPQKVPHKAKKKQDMSAWFNLFADLDPLSNPDAIGKNDSEVTDA